MATLFTKDLLFLHVPKTGGSSVAEYLFEVLPRPIWCVCEYPAACDRGGVTYLEGRKHSTLAEAGTLLRQRGLDLNQMRVILAVVRNPYEAAVSEYSYFRRPDVFPSMRGQIHELAVVLPFPEYVFRVICGPGHFITARLAQYYTIGGQVPANLCIVRFEDLADGVRAALSEIGVESDASLPWLNASPHDDYLSYYDSAAEEAIYQRCRWVFDQGYYPRLQLTTTGFNARR
jgi:hypothetical protein